MDNLDNNLFQYLDKLKTDIENILKADLVRQGFPNRTTLAKLTVTNDASDLTLNIPDEIYYWDRGRKSGGKRIPLSALLTWIKDRGISPRNGKSVTQLAWAIQTHIWQRGISSKNILDKAIDLIEVRIGDEILDFFSDQIDNIIADSFL